MFQVGILVREIWQLVLAREAWSHEQDEYCHKQFGEPRKKQQMMLLLQGLLILKAKLGKK